GALVGALVAGAQDRVAFDDAPQGQVEGGRVDGPAQPQRHRHVVDAGVVRVLLPQEPELPLRRRQGRRAVVAARGDPGPAGRPAVPQHPGEQGLLGRGESRYAGVEVVHAGTLLRRSRTERGVRSVHTSAMWARHSSRVPVKPVSVQPAGRGRSGNQTEYCSSMLTTTRKRMLSLLMGCLTWW